MTLTNDERRDTLQRLQPQRAMAAIEVKQPHAKRVRFAPLKNHKNYAATQRTQANGWVLDPTHSMTDRLYRCARCATVVILRGILGHHPEGSVTCCGEIIADHHLAPPRPRNWERSWWGDL